MLDNYVRHYAVQKKLKLSLCPHSMKMYVEVQAQTYPSVNLSLERNLLVATG
jgi:hypothetical protein